jgi:hypothetical protein
MGDLYELADQAEADRVMFEREGVQPPQVGDLAAAYIHVRRPDDDDLVFVPGELLPGWLVALLRAGHGDYDPDRGAWLVQPPPPPPPPKPKPKPRSKKR